MIVGEEKINSITITDNEGGVLAVINDKKIVEHEGYKVILERKPAPES
ncbi:hypothetical protein [Orenia marismortui]|uniref:Uncharacterized protein n=1 Tax=Orenia marismortui TaxID=46469 RepID=A0A4R8GSX4_9FIRM|nr:hypothetical protein [Orenia marismortui]TDX49113.1 hypothetical protein C7959_1207 [Orenia marismortui]